MEDNMADKLYDKHSIESLDPLAFTRLKPGVYCGDTTYATQLLIEILSNSIDEFRLGHGNKIEIDIDKDKVRVRDYGQGFLVNEIREDGKTVLEAAFSVLNTSGKYRADGVYEGTSLGSFGIGSKLANFLSHWMDVFTYRDGKMEHIHFNEGVFETRYLATNCTLPTGTCVEWQPSEEFFTHTEVDLSAIRPLLKTIVSLCQGLTITLTVDGKKEEYYSKNGLSDLADDAVKNKEIIKNRLNIKHSDGKNKLDLILTYTTNYSATVVPYVNTGLTDSGPHISQIKSVLTRELNKFFRAKKWLKEKDENLTGDDISEGLYIVFNITAPEVAYNAQVKTTITKIDMTPFTKVFAEELQNWFEVNEKEIKKIADKALQARKAREAARKAKEAVRTPKEKGLKAKMQLSNKFLDCTNKEPSKRDLILVEGTSAASAVVEARNAKTDAIYLLRGKIISPLKTPIDKILANQEMSDIIRVIGAGFGSSFDASKIQFDKVVITSDQDSDGADIELLLIAFFYTYMRPLVEAGKLYRAVTPLYIVRKGGKEYYCYSEDELAEWKKTHSGTYDLLRAKGVGELNAVDLHKVCFENKRYKRITISDIEKTTELLNILQGPDVEPRKKYIYDNATRLGFDFT